MFILFTKLQVNRIFSCNKLDTKLYSFNLWAKLSATPSARHLFGHQHQPVAINNRYLSEVLNSKVVTTFYRNMTSRPRQNFHEKCEELLNKQINMELYASYVYLSMAYYFDRDDVALPGMHWYFKKSSDEEREHAMKFLKYLNKRGGRVILAEIKNPDKKEWGTAEDAMRAALDLEKQVNESLLEMHFVASDMKDANFCDFLETEFLQEQVDAIKELSDHITNLERVGNGLGVYMFDKQLIEHDD